MKLLIIGSEGFIGSNLIDYLKSHFEITGIDTKNTTRNTGIKYIKANIFSYNEKKIPPINNINLAIYCAGNPLTRDLNFKKNLKYETSLFINFLNLCIKNNIKNIIFISSKKIEEKKHKYSTYSTIKKILEEISQMYSNNYGLNITCLRIPNTFSKKFERLSQIMPIFKRNISKSKEIQIFDNSKIEIITSNKLVKTIKNLIKKNLNGFNLYSIYSNKISPLRISKIISKELGTKLKYKIINNSKNPNKIKIKNNLNKNIKNYLKK